MASAFQAPLLDAISESDIKSCQPIADQDIVEWLEQHADLQGQYAISGPFRVGPSRYLIEPLRAAQDWSCKQITILKATQTGGSLAADLILQWYIVNRPLPVMWICQTNPDAKVHMTSRLIPSLRANESVAPFLPTDGRKLTEEGIQFPHGMNFLINGPSKDRLHGKSIALLICDELWRWGKDGLFEWAKKRVGYYSKYGMSKVIVVSQAGEEGDELHLAWLESSQEEWNVNCLKCGEYFFPDIEHINADGRKWNDPKAEIKNQDGSYDYGKLEKLLSVQCPKCGHLHKDTPEVKQQWNLNGKYIASNPSPLQGHRGFRWNSIICDPWIDIVKEFLQATIQVDKGNNIPLLTFFQQRLAKAINVWSWFVKGRAVKSNVDYNPLDKIPNEVARFFAVDLQQDRFYGVIRAYASDGASRLLWFGEMYDIQDILDRQKEFSVPNHCVVMDTGYGVRTREAYSYVVDYGFTGIKGVGAIRGFKKKSTSRNGRVKIRFHFWKQSVEGGDPTGGNPADKGKRGPRVPFYLLAVDSLKDVLTRLRDGKGSEFLALPSETYNITEYNKHMYSEYKRKELNSRGKEQFYWRKIRSDERNDYWDCEVYILGMVMMHPGIGIKEMGALPSSDYQESQGQEDKQADQYEETESVEDVAA